MVSEASEGEQSGQNLYGLPGEETGEERPVLWGWCMGSPWQGSHRSSDGQSSRSGVRESGTPPAAWGTWCWTCLRGAAGPMVWPPCPQPGCPPSAGQSAKVVLDLVGGGLFVSRQHPIKSREITGETTHPETFLLTWPRLQYLPFARLTRSTSGSPSLSARGQGVEERSPGQAVTVRAQRVDLSRPSPVLPLSLQALTLPRVLGDVVRDLAPEGWGDRSL